MRDYSEVLGKRNKKRNRQRQQQQNQPQNTDQGITSGSFSRSNPSVRSLANVLGTSAETAQRLGIPRKAAHRIVDTAYGQGGQGQGGQGTDW